MSDACVKEAGAQTRQEYLTGEPPKERQRPLGAGKGDEHRPIFVSKAEYARRQWILWCDCPRCGRQQYRSNIKCIRCGAKLPQTKYLSTEK
jgi:hypothetical protein